MTRFAIILAFLSLTACLPIQEGDETFSYRGETYTVERWRSPSSGRTFRYIRLAKQRYICNLDSQRSPRCRNLIDQFLDDAGFGKPQEDGPDFDPGISDYDGGGGGDGDGDGDGDDGGT